MKQQKLVYLDLYSSTCNEETWGKAVEFPLQDYFDDGWRVASYQFRDIEDNNPVVVVLLEKGE